MTTQDPQTPMAHCALPQPHVHPARVLGGPQASVPIQGPCCSLSPRLQHQAQTWVGYSQSFKTSEVAEITEVTDGGARQLKEHTRRDSNSNSS